MPANTADVTSVAPPGLHSQSLEIFTPRPGQVYTDDFEDEKEAGSPSPWIENNKHNYWNIAREGANNVYRVKSNEVSTWSWLHVFERDVTFDVRFKVAEVAKEDAELKFAVRFNDYEALVYLGYNFKTEKWYLAEQRGKDFEEVVFEQVINSKREVEPLKTDVWYHIRVLSENETVTVYINDMTRPKLWATDVRHQSPGRVALGAYNATVDFDDVALNLRSGQGRVNEGVLEYTIGDDDRFREGASIVEKSNGDLLLLHRSEEFHSSDQGETFTGPFPFSWPKNAHGHHSVLRLKSGKLLNMVAERAGKGQGARFRAKLSSDDGATWVDGGVTWEAYREGLPGKSEVIVMNDKLTQVPNGRIFFVVPVRKDDGEKITGHKTEIYYSDDEGKTWNQSKNDSDDFTEINRYAEGKVIQTSKGTLRLYTPGTPPIVCGIQYPATTAKHGRVTSRWISSGTQDHPLR
ncbi:sialidase family protein [Anseongella ginsenosidimutans]|uniref:sialidase family protein n=1 Tax=Anseongella ginsenosidimutans TaxID=496056 RepID=UPI0011CC6133|nr:sialidase family protein [Anseongella ginsenosidimutans]QEC52380.1 exo-alpha-sialidase [Anseongella ginsenosidimutans]